VFKFITRRPFWLNALVAIILAALLLFGTLKLLGIMTKHGEILTVPKVINTNTAAAIKLLESKGFEVLVQDSVYTDSAKLGTVLKQFPDANSTVKVNRLVLLTVNRVTLPNIDVPNLISKSKDYAIEIIERSHFKLGDTTFKPSYMMGAVIAQYYNGVEVKPGTKIPWGSKIDLEIGSGLSDVQFPVPSLLGLTVEQAKEVLLQNNLLLASIIPDAGTTDTAHAYVYKQNPPRENEDKTINYIRQGQVMDMWVSPVMKVVADTTSLDVGELEEQPMSQQEKADRDKEKRQKDKAAKDKVNKDKTTKAKTP
jgi:eukaryotic-like serine/threonine-protein kinase